MAEIISDMKVRHRKELARKDKELVAIQMDLQHQRSARMALEKQHKVELAVLARKHKDDMEAAADIATKRVDDEWDLRERAEKVRLGRELSGKSAAQAKIEGAKKQRRNELLTTLQEHNRGIRSLETRQKDGTLAFTKEEEVPSKEQCLDGLASIWTVISEWLSRILPHELIADRDVALGLEVDVVAARVFMLTLQFWGASAQEVLRTGWSWTVLHRLNCGLVPYCVDTPLTTLSVAVGAICDILQKAVMDTQNVGKHDVANNAGGIDWTAGQTMTNVTAPGSQQRSDFGHPMQPDPHFKLPSLNFTEASPPLNVQSANSAYAEEDPFEAEIRRLSHLPDAGPMRGASYVDGLDFAPPTVSASVAKPCYNMANTGFCKFGDNCKFSHDVAAGQGSTYNKDNLTNLDGQAASARIDKRATMPCNNIKKFGSCRKANCPFMYPPGLHISTGSADPPTFENQQPQQQPNRPCRNEQNNGSCMRPNCRWEHQFPHGSDNANRHGNNDGNFQDQDTTQASKQCWNERDKGRCIKSNCHFAHHLPHGPTGANTPQQHGFGQRQQQQQQQQVNRRNGNGNGDRTQRALAAFMKKMDSPRDRSGGLGQLSQGHMASFQNVVAGLQGGGGDGGGRRGRRNGRG